jgi:adenine/guanine phosphoribosyltransferase-like PRPP-binding protein
MGEYIQQNIPRIQKLIDGFKSITEFNGRKINFICMGSSGAIVAALFSLQVRDSRIIHIKKENERSHHGNYFYPEDFKDTVNVIVDDFVGTGATLNKIYSEIIENCPHIHCVCVTRWNGEIEFEPDYLVSK